MRLRLLSAALLLLLASVPAVAQARKTPAAAQHPECTWKIESWGDALVRLPEGGVQVSGDDDPGKRAARLGQIHMQPMGRWLDLVVYVDISQPAGAPKIEGRQLTTTRVVVDGKELYRGNQPSKVVIPLGDAFGAKPEEAKDAVLEVFVSFDGEKQKGKEHRLFVCQLKGTAGAMSSVLETQRKRQSEFDASVLGWSVATLALGGVILLAVLLDGSAKFMLAAAIGVAAAIIVEPVLTPGMPESISAPWSLVLLIGVGAALAASVCYLARAIVVKLDVYEPLRETLDPSRWKVGPRPGEGIPKEHIRRWFVTIGAMTGAVVGSMIGLDFFWTALRSWFEARNLLLAVLLVAVSFFFSGPVQAYVFDWSAGAKEPSDPSKKLADILSAGDWRAAGRFGAVAFMLVAIYLVTSCFATTVKQGDSRVLAAVICAGVTPAVASYYWSAALQRSAASVLETAALPALSAGAAMAFGSALLLAFGLLDRVGAFSTTSPGDRNLVGAVLALPVVAVVAACVLSAVTTLPFALAGGYVIDRLGGRDVMLYMTAALFITGLMVAAVLGLTLRLIGFSAGNIGYSTLICSTLGWSFGLWASGFPRLVTGGQPAK